MIDVNENRGMLNVKALVEKTGDNVVGGRTIFIEIQLGVKMFDPINDDFRIKTCKLAGTGLF